MLEVRQCSFLEFGAFPELPALIEEYVAESSIEGMPPANYYEANYLRLERSGNATLLVATLNDTLIGFVILVVSLNARYNAPVAAFEAFFVADEYRKTGAGLKLRKAAEELAKDKGAVGVFVGAPVDSRAARFMERDKSYRETNRVFFRSLV